MKKFKMYFIIKKQQFEKIHCNYIYNVIAYKFLSLCTFIDNDITLFIWTK
jgi:hypothetical protein